MYIVCSDLEGVFVPEIWINVSNQFIFATITVFAVPTLIAVAFKYWPKTPMGKKFLGELPTDEEVLPEESRRGLIGRVGVARSKMLPSGAVEVDGQMIDAVTQGQAIEPGAYVVIIEVRANRVVVRPAGKDQRPSHQNPKDMLSHRSTSWESSRWTTRWRDCRRPAPLPRLKSGPRPITSDYWREI